VRVLYLNPFSQEVSGPDESLRTLLAQLVPLGVEPHVVLPASGPQVVRYEALGARVHFEPLAALRRDISLAAAAYPAQLLRSAWSIAALARRLRADLVHTNMEVLLEGGLAARALRLPHVLHYRGNTLDRPKLVFDALTRTWTALSDRIFCISGATAEVFRKRGLGRRVEVLYNPIDLARFSPGPAAPEVRASLGARSGELLIGTVGRIHPRKDLETFVLSAVEVARALPAARFVIVGEAEAPVELAYREQLQALIHRVGLDERILLAGARRDVPDVMRALDLFVLTSRHEGFGRVVAEAMGAARPIVVTDEGALPELVERGKYGLCAPAADPGAFALRALELLREPARGWALGQRAREGAAQFDAGSVAGRVWDRYRALVLKRTGPPTAPAR